MDRASIKLKGRKVGLLEVSVAYGQILYYFFSYPQQAIGLNDLAESIGASKTSTRAAVLKLEKEGFLKKEAIGKAWRIFADPKDPYFITRKIPYNLQLIYESDIIARAYYKVPEARAIMLFGSYRYGSDNENSDIDIAAEVLDGKELRVEPLVVFEQFGYRKKVKVNLHIFSRSKISLELFTNIANGVVLGGLLEVKP